MLVESVNILIGILLGEIFSFYYIMFITGEEANLPRLNMEEQLCTILHSNKEMNIASAVKYGMRLAIRYLNDRFLLFTL